LDNPALPAFRALSRRHLANSPLRFAAHPIVKPQDKAFIMFKIEMTDALPTN
jgi:hypothetical protein